MPKKAKPSNHQSFEKEYAKVTKGNKTIPCPIQFPQWISPGDFFVKFSLYEETSSGTTATETSVIING